MSLSSFRVCLWLVVAVNVTIVIDQAAWIDRLWQIRPWLLTVSSCHHPFLFLRLAQIVLFLKVIAPRPVKRNHSVFQRRLKHPISHVLHELVLFVHFRIHLHDQSDLDLRLSSLNSFGSYLRWYLHKTTVCLIVQICTGKRWPIKGAASIVFFKTFVKFLKPSLFYLHRLEFVHSENWACFLSFVSWQFFLLFFVHYSRGVRHFGTWAEISVVGHTITLCAVWLLIASLLATWLASRRRADCAMATPSRPLIIALLIR